MSQPAPAAVIQRDVTEAAFLQQVQARPLYTHVSKHNRGSLRGLEKCGFTIMGEVLDATDAGGEQIEEYLLRLGPKEQRQ